MSVTFIPTIGSNADNSVVAEVIKMVRNPAQYASDNGVILYAGWPQVKDYSGKTHVSDITIIGCDYGVKLVKVSSSLNGSELKRDAVSILQAAASTESLLSKSLTLKKKRRLVFDVVPILYAPNLPAGTETAEDVEVATSIAELEQILKEKNTFGSFSSDQLKEAQAIIEGAKALGQMGETDDAADLHPVAKSYNDLEAKIYNFDTTQRSVALTATKGPQRIRGLAGTGKTVILAMKAALAHIENPNQKILVTYYTRSSRDVIERLITRFHRHFAETDPDWDSVHVRHGWGRSNLPGVYRDTCIRSGRSPKSYNDVKSSVNPFDTVCRELVDDRIIKPFYDVILIDEGQDFPDSFYQMCFYLAKGARDSKQIVWAYDELQTVFDVQVREPEKLFGLDDDGQARVSLARSLSLGTDTNDFVLQRSYRNQREVLVLAHSIGFGVYGKTVQMLENSKHWEDVGYDIVSGSFETGSENIVERPLRNSPSVLDTPAAVPLIDLFAAGDFESEVTKATENVVTFVKSGIAPHNIMVISLDDRSAKSYFSSISKKLIEHDILCNNIIRDPYSEPPFRIDGMVTLSTVYRAKGNEAAVVIVLGADAANLRTRTGRNKLFVAFTRTKGWLRVSGFNGKVFDSLLSEVKISCENIPRVVFEMPDMNTLNTIQRGLEEKQARLLEVKQRIDRMKAELNLSDDDIESIIED